MNEFDRLDVIVNDEGETLQARIKRGPLPVAEALTIAKQIAEALEARHEKAVVQRANGIVDRGGAAARGLLTKSSDSLQNSGSGRSATMVHDFDDDIDKKRKTR